MLQHPGRVPGRKSGSERETATSSRGGDVGRTPSFAQSRAAYDAQQIERAAYFTAVLFLGRGQYAREERGSLPLAREAAQKLEAWYGRRALVYAVTPEGLTIAVD
jgi:hypothetical protein